jgi:glycerol-3-phosphate cytidylyltransferase
VDQVVAKTSTNNIEAWKVLKFDFMIKGDDWKGTKKGLELEKELAEVGALVKYLPYTQETSSSILRLAISNIH